MYHKFIPLTTTEQHMNSKLHSIIDYYTTTQPTISILGLPTVVSIKFSLYNQRHNTQFIVLSNSRVVRYDYRQEEIYELEGLEDVEIVEVRVLETGRDQKYLLLTEDGVVVCTFQTVEGEKSIEEEKVDGQHMMMEVQQVVQTEKNRKAPKSLSCQLYGKLFLQLSQMSQQPNLNQIMVENMFPQHQVQIRNLQIVMGSRTQTHSYAFIILLSKHLNKANYNIMIYKLTTIHGNTNTINQSPTTHQKQPTKQLTILQPMKLSNSHYNMQISLCGVKVPFDITQQQQQLNPIQVTESNAKYTKTHPIVSIDRQVDQNCSFSLYFSTQAITEEMEQSQFRHTVFQFQFLTSNQKSEIVVNCPVFEYPQKKVICPLRVYYLPLVQQSSILRHLTVTKTLSSSKTNKQSVASLLMEQTKNTSPNSTAKKLTFTTALMHSHGKIVFESVQCNITEEQQNKKFSYYLNHQNVLFSTVVDEKIVLRDVLLIDGHKRYAILLVNDGSIKINEEFLAVKKLTHKLQNQQQQRNGLKIVFINLRPVSQGLSRIVSEQKLHPSYNDTITSLSLHIPNTNNTSPIKSTHPFVQSFLNQKKTIHLSNSRTNTQQIHGIINLVPKTEIYHQMLFDLLGPKGKKETFAFQYKSLNHEIFYSSIIRTLSI